MVYEVKYQTHKEQFDGAGRLKPSAILYFAQEAAGDHAAALGLGWDTLHARGIFWAVIRTRAEVFASCAPGTPVTVKTWPMPTTRTAYPRCVMGYDQNGTLLFKVMSLWVLMDEKSRGMVLPGKSGVTVEGAVFGGEPDMPKSLPVKQLPESTKKTVTENLLDMNGHMNNTRYMDWVLELTDTQKPIKGFDLCYFNEGRLGDEMVLDYGWQADILTVDIHRKRTDVAEKTDRVFAAAVQY